VQFSSASGYSAASQTGRPSPPEPPLPELPPLPPLPPAPPAETSTWASPEHALSAGSGWPPAPPLTPPSTLSSAWGLVPRGDCCTDCLEHATAIQRDKERQDQRIHFMACPTFWIETVTNRRCPMSSVATSTLRARCDERLEQIHEPEPGAQRLVPEVGHGRAGCSRG
jgi:hypothetical protein